MNEASTTGEGSPQMEAAERHILGAENYEKAEVVHRFADTHPWFHPTLLLGTVAIFIFAIVVVMKYIRAEPEAEQEK